MGKGARTKRLEAMLRHARDLVLRTWCQCGGFGCHTLPCATYDFLTDVGKELGEPWYGLSVAATSGPESGAK